MKSLLKNKIRRKQGLHKKKGNRKLLSLKEVNDRIEKSNKLFSRFIDEYQ